MKYKFKENQKVFPVGKKRIFKAENTKHRQKWEGVVLKRFFDEAAETNVYVIKTEAGLILAKEACLTSIKEKVLGWVVVKDVNNYAVYKSEKPTNVEQGCVMLEIWGVPYD
jgi:hypothetical protein